MLDNHDDELEEYWDKIRILGQHEWGLPHIVSDTEHWLTNFAESDHKHFLHLLSLFMYYNEATIRSLLKYMFWEKILYPVVQRLPDIPPPDLDQDLENVIKRTRFVGIGNPSESGAFLLYYFRQVNEIPVTNFIHSQDLFNSDDTDFDSVYFLDDFSGSGTAIKRYLSSLKDSYGSDIFEKRMNKIKASIIVLFATTRAKNKLKSVLDDYHIKEIESVVELDESYRAFNSKSRYFTNPLRNDLKAILESYTKGMGLNQREALGFANSQLLLGFHYNTPNNTLPVFWSSKNCWKPIFARYQKSSERYLW